ncbi:MAG: PIN domain-containing protein [Methanobacteriota archaeon]
MRTSDKPKIVVDTNVIFSGLYDLKSDAGRLFVYAIEDRIELYSSNYIKNELERNLKSKLEYTEEEFKETIKALPINWVEDEDYSKEIKKAEKLIEHDRDIPVLALALYLKCGVVSGDKHLQSISSKDFKCWKLKELIEYIKALL